MTIDVIISEVNTNIVERKLNIWNIFLTCKYSVLSFLPKSVKLKIIRLSGHASLTFSSLHRVWYPMCYTQMYVPRHCSHSAERFYLPVPEVDKRYETHENFNLKIHCQHKSCGHVLLIFDSFFLYMNILYILIIISFFHHQCHTLFCS